MTYLDHLEFILAWRMQDAILTAVGKMSKAEYGMDNCDREAVFPYVC